MFVIIEGPDGVGKTTAAKAIAKIPSWDLCRMTKPDESFDHFTGYMNALRTRCVYDRFHLGAVTYGNLSAGKSQQTTADRVAMVARAIRFFGGIVVIMYSGTDAWLRTHLIERQEVAEMYSIDRVLRVNEAYRWLASGNKAGELFGAKICDISHDVADLGYPTESQLAMWVEYASSRLESNDNPSGASNPFILKRTTR